MLSGIGSLSNRLQTIVSVPCPWSLRWDLLSSLRTFDDSNISSSQRSLRAPEKTGGTSGSKWEAMNSLVEARYSSQLHWEEGFHKEGTLKSIKEADSREQSKEVEKIPESFRAQIARVAGKRRRETRARVDKDSSIFRKDNNLDSSVKDRDSGCYSGSGSGSSEEETLEEQKNNDSEKQAGDIRGCSASATNTLMDFKFWRGGVKGWEGSCSSSHSPPSSLRTGGNFLLPRSLPERRSREMRRALPGSHWRGVSNFGHNYQRGRRFYS